MKKHTKKGQLVGRKKKKKTSRMQKNKFLFSIIYLRNEGGGKSSFMKKRLFCNTFKTCMSKS